mgnify:CR=1 FL=1
MFQNVLYVKQRHIESQPFNDDTSPSIIGWHGCFFFKFVNSCWWTLPLWGLLFWLCFKRCAGSPCAGNTIHWEGWAALLTGLRQNGRITSLLFHSSALSATLCDDPFRDHMLGFRLFLCGLPSVPLLQTQIPRRICAGPSMMLLCKIASRGLLPCGELYVCSPWVLRQGTAPLEL